MRGPSFAGKRFSCSFLPFAVPDGRLSRASGALRVFSFSPSLSSFLDYVLVLPGGSIESEFYENGRWSFAALDGFRPGFRWSVLGRAGVKPVVSSSLACALVPGTCRWAAGLSSVKRVAMDVLGELASCSMDSRHFQLAPLAEFRVLALACRWDRWLDGFRQRSSCASRRAMTWS